MKSLEKIKEEIRTINPEITDELLDLLYEYIFTKERQPSTISSNSKNSEDAFVLWCGYEYRAYL